MKDVIFICSIGKREGGGGMETNEKKNMLAFWRGNKLFLCSDVWEPLNGRKEYSISAKKVTQVIFLNIIIDGCWN